MNQTPLPWALLPLLLLTGCAVENPALAEQARDARLAVLRPARVGQGPREATAGTTSTNDDTLAPPDAAAKKKCDDHDRRGDKAGQCERDGGKPSQGSR